VSNVAAGAAPVSKAAGPLHITFICSGNICRSPMAEKMFAHQISERGLADAVRVTSAGTGGWHAGEPADRRASHVLRAHGYPTSHRAAQIDDDHLAADLVIALGRNHVRMLTEMGVDEGLATTIVMRALYWPDAFPCTDRALQSAAGAASPRALRTRAEKWRPWRAYAALHLWLQHGGR